MDFKTIMIDKSKLIKIENEINNEMNCLVNTLNINNFIDYYNSSNNKEIKKYKNKISSNILFNNKNFLRILYKKKYLSKIISTLLS